MHPEFGSLRAYPVVYLAGVLLHAVLAYIFCRRLGLRRWWYQSVSLSYLLSMTAGARVLFDVTHGASVKPLALLTVSYYMRGGMWGGPLVHLALITVVILALARQRAAAFDLVALSLPLPMMLAKVGCFLNGCCYGAPTALPWGVTFPANPGGAPPNVPIHPVQLYEIGVLAVVFATVITLRSPRWSGLRLAWFLLIYGVGRGLIEFLRGDAVQRLALGAFTASQLLCLCVAVVAAVVLGIGARRAR
ncbi:MAG TPA: prolipoprotein diacylglyceryl transferase family protein [Phycisphaerae bacterium]|nr:prolipoprotein diacylglyceryl transferase family protein [Phycisphaerae bacterium]